MPDSSSSPSQPLLSVMIDRKATSVLAFGRRLQRDYSEASTPQAAILDGTETATPLLGQMYEQQANSLLGLPLVVEANDK